MYEFSVLEWLYLNIEVFTIPPLSIPLILHCLIIIYSLSLFLTDKIPNHFVITKIVFIVTDEPYPGLTIQHKYYNMQSTETF